MGTRSIDRIIDGMVTREGEGFQVRRPFPTRALDHFDPFLLLDEMGPVSLKPGEAKGAPDHPHRGFETVTYLLEGRMRHKDSQGHSGSLGPGDVQWMTAGAGVVHSEMPDPELLESGGRLHGFQLWVNLPSRDKMMAPRYQEISSREIPDVQSDDGTIRVRVIAGEALGRKAVISTQTPIVYLHYRLAAGAQARQAAPPGFNVLAYVFKGSGRFAANGHAAREGQMVIFGDDGDAVEFSASEPLECLILGGQPLREPVVRYGPFVMNTQAEIVQAFEDYRAGRLGNIGF